MSTDVIAKNLLRLRVDQELTQEELAFKADVSLTAYKNIESGTTEPKISTLQAIASVLGVAFTDLFIPIRELKFVRFRADKKMKRRSQVLSMVSRWLENYEILETELGQKETFLLEPLIKELQAEPVGKQRAILAANKVRALLHDPKLNSKNKQFLGKMDEPIQDICGLFEKLGIKVHTMDMATDSFFGLSVSAEDGGPAIIVNCWERLSVERRIFTAAHELGHLLLHTTAYDIEQQDEIQEQEDEANYFASYFLMPEESFNRKKQELEGYTLFKMVIKLKSLFKVSYQSVLVRLSKDRDNWKLLMEQFKSDYFDETGKELSIKDEAEPLLHPSEFDARPPVPRKADEPKNLSEEVFEEARLEKLVRLAIEHDIITTSKAADILEVDLEQVRKRMNAWISIKNAEELLPA